MFYITLFTGAVAHGEFLLESRLGSEGEFFSASSKPEFSLIYQSSAYFRYNQEYFGSEENSSYITAMGIRFQKMGRKDFVLDGDVFFSYEEEEPYYDIRDFHYFHPTGGGWTVRAGRARHLWSRADEFWQQGLWQPRFTWDEVDTRSQGLIGVLAEGQLDKGVSLAVMASPVFVPELNQSFKVNDEGRIVSPNPWFRPPPPVVELLGQKTNVRTQVNQPELADVVFNPGFVAQLKWQKKQRFMAMSYAYKPVNQYYNSLTATDQARDNTDFLHVIVEPRFLYHHLLSLEAGQSWNQWQTWGSMNLESPVKDEPNMEGVYQDPNDAISISAYTSYDFRRVLKKNVQWYGGYIHLEGGDKEDGGKLASKESKFERRYRYQSALRTGFKNTLPFRWMRIPVTTASDVTYDFKQRAAIFSSEINMAFLKTLTASLRVDVLGLIDTKEPQVEDGFLRTYRANDRVQMGVSYVF